MAAELKRLESFDTITAERARGTVLVFKHSATCGTSLFAKEQVHEYLGQGAHDVHMLVVQEQRDLSNRIAAELGVRHESPQLLIITAGGARALNHYNITAKNIADRADG